MKKYFNILIVLLITIFGCTDKQHEIEELIKKQDYVKAQARLNSLSKEEKQDPKIKEFQTVISFNNFLDTINTLAKEKNYIMIDSLINLNISNFKPYSNLTDSLLFIGKSYAFDGANFYYSKKKMTQAYQCIIKYSSANSLTDSQNKIIRYLKSKIISGNWVGYKLIGNTKNKVRMLIEPIDDSTFSGIILFDNQRIWSELYDGVFDGIHLSADYFLGISRYKEVLKRANGIYNNGILTMMFPVVVTKAEVKHYSDGGEFVALETKIIRIKCAMKKKK